MTVPSRRGFSAARRASVAGKAPARVRFNDGALATTVFAIHDHQLDHDDDDEAEQTGGQAQSKVEEVSTTGDVILQSQLPDPPPSPGTSSNPRCH